MLCRYRHFQNDLKDPPRYGQQIIFSLSFSNVGYMGKKLFFNTDQNKRPFPRNVDIYVDMGYSKLRWHSQTLTCSSVT